MKIKEVTIDNRNGRGSVPYNQDVDYRGMRVNMRPTTFIKLAAPLGRDQAKQEMIDYVKNGGAIGAPFLIINYREGKTPEVVGHEGRNRMLAVYAAEGDDPVETHLFFRGDVSRARHLTPEIVALLKKGMEQEVTGQSVRGPLWEDGKIVKGVNTTADVKPGETKRQAAKFGNKIGKDGQPPLLNAKARKNSSPHMLSNLGLAESTQSVAYGYKIMNYNPDTGEVISGADSRVTKGLKLTKGMTMKMPGKGIFMSTNKEYVETYYSGHNDNEVLIKFKFDPNTITSGNMTDRESEFTVPSATVVGFKIINNLDEAIRTINRGKDDKFNIDTTRYKVSGKPIAKMNGFTIHYEEKMQGDRGIIIAKGDEVAGLIILSYLSNIEQKVLGIGTSVVADNFQGKGIVYKAYIALIKAGYSLISDDTQTKGGQIIWKKLANTPGVFVYGISNITTNATYTQIDPDDMSGDIFAVYHTEHNEIGDLEDQLGQMSRDIQELKYQIEDMETDIEQGYDHPEIDDYRGKLKSMGYEAKAILDELFALKKDYGNSRYARLMATADKKDDVSEAIAYVDSDKGDKFDIDPAKEKKIVMPKGDPIASFDNFNLVIDSDNPLWSDGDGVFVIDTTKKKIAGVIGLQQEYGNISNIQKNVLQISTSVVSSKYEGRSIILKAYLALISAGYSLLSDTSQTVGGRKLWARIARAPGIYVYAVNFPKSTSDSAVKRGKSAIDPRGNTIKFYDVDPDDITDGAITVYIDSSAQEELDWLVAEKEKLWSEWNKAKQIAMKAKTNSPKSIDAVDRQKMLAKEIKAMDKDIDKLYAKIDSGDRPGKTMMMATSKQHTTESSQVNESNIRKPHPKDTLGVKRHEMPQVHAQHYPELMQYLKDNGATMKKGSVHAKELKAVQSEFSDEGVEKMIRKGGITADGSKKPLIVSSDNYIIDGHHRWLAAYNQDEMVPIIKVSLPVKVLLQLVRDFRHTTYQDIYQTVKENISVTGTEHSKQDRKKKLQPGTDAWFKHWFSRPYLTREEVDRLKEEAIDFIKRKKGVHNEKTSRTRRSNRNTRTNERRST